MEIFTADTQVVSRVGSVPGISPAEARALLEVRLLVDGQPIFLDDRMRPVEPVSSWFRSLALGSRSKVTARMPSRSRIRPAAVSTAAGSA